jgi:hypothetical protein
MSALSSPGDEFLAGDLDPHRLDIFLEKGIEFFDNDQSVHLRGEMVDQVAGEGKGHTQLEEAGVWENLACVLIGYAAGYYAELLRAPGNLIQRGGLGIFCQIDQPLLHHGVAKTGVDRQHDVFPHIVPETGRDWWFASACLQVHH